MSDRRLPARADWLVSDELAPSSHGPLAPLFEAAHRGILVLPSCGGCGIPLDLDQARCDSCDARDVVWREVPSASGTVHSATLVHRLERGLIRAEQPYPVLDVDLTSGHRLVMTTLEPSDTLPSIGDDVEIGFRDVDGTLVPAALVGRATSTHREGKP